MLILSQNDDTLCLRCSIYVLVLPNLVYSNRYNHVGGQHNLYRCTSWCWIFVLHNLRRLLYFRYKISCSDLYFPKKGQEKRIANNFICAFIFIFLKSCSFSFIWFVIQWLYAHPTFLGNQLYIGGDSYSGLIVPILLQNILEGKSLNSEILAPIMHTRPIVDWYGDYIGSCTNQAPTVDEVHEQQYFDLKEIKFLLILTC